MTTFLRYEVVRQMSFALAAWVATIVVATVAVEALVYATGLRFAWWAFAPVGVLAQPLATRAARRVGRSEGRR